MKVEKKLKLNFLISNRNNEKKIIKLFKQNDFLDYFIFYGLGSASSEILEYLGIGESEKIIFIVPTSQTNSEKLFNLAKTSEILKQALIFNVPVKGISSLKSLNYLLKEEE